LAKIAVVVLRKCISEVEADKMEGEVADIRERAKQPEERKDTCITVTHYNSVIFLKYTFSNYMIYKSPFCPKYLLHWDEIKLMA
jgi:hypothetical protein